MNHSNHFSLIILLVVTLFIAFIIQKVLGNQLSLKKYLANLSTDFEAFYQLFHKFNKCQLNDQGYTYAKTEIEKLLVKSEYVGLNNPRIMFLKNKQCIDVNIRNDVTICYGKFKETSNCMICQKVYDEVVRNIGFKLENGVMKSYLSKNDMIIYKKYRCKGEDLYIVIIFQI